MREGKGRERSWPPSLYCKAISVVNRAVEVIVEACWSLDGILPKASQVDPAAEITSAILWILLLPRMVLPLYVAAI